MKTAVSEAVTNVIIHGYEKEVRKVYIKCMIEENIFTVEVCDQGKGIENIEEAMCPMYTTRPDQDRSGMGFAFMEAFMDSVEVESELGEGTRVRMIKGSRKRQGYMDDTIALIRKSHSGDKAAREQLVKENVGLVHCVVKRFLERGAEREDLFQIGSIGLLKAIDKFDLTYNVKFSTYAVPLISGKSSVSCGMTESIKVSRSLKEIAYKSVQARERLISSLGREPTMRRVIRRSRSGKRRTCTGDGGRDARLNPFTGRFIKKKEARYGFLINWRKREKRRQDLGSDCSQRTSRDTG